MSEVGFYQDCHHALNMELPLKEGILETSFVIKCCYTHIHRYQFLSTDFTWSTPTSVVVVCFCTQFMVLIITCKAFHDGRATFPCTNACTSWGPCGRSLTLALLTFKNLFTVGRILTFSEDCFFWNCSLGDSQGAITRFYKITREACVAWSIGRCVQWLLLRMVMFSQL